MACVCYPCPLDGSKVEYWFRFHYLIIFFLGNLPHLHALLWLDESEVSDFELADRITASQWGFKGSRRGCSYETCLEEGKIILSINSYEMNILFNIKSSRRYSWYSIIY